MATIQTRLTSDNKQHDEAFKRSKQQVYNYNKQVDQSKASVLKFAKGGLGALGTALGLAGGAITVFTKLMRSTEQTSDNLDRSIYTLKSGVDKFFQALASGGATDFIGQLRDIKQAAKEAYDSLDKLSTSKMWKNARIQQYQAEIEKLRTDNALGRGDRGENNKQIKALQKAIDDLNDSLTKETNNAAKNVLDDILGLNVKEDYGKKLIEYWEQGTLESYIEWYKNTHSHIETKTVSGGGYTYTVSDRIWDEGAEKFYNALNKLLNTKEGDKLKQYYDLKTEVAAREEQAAKKERKNLGGTTTTTSTSKTNKSKTIAEILEWEEENPIEDFKFDDEAVNNLISNLNTLAEVLEDKLIPIDVDSWIGDTEKKEWDLAKATEDANKNLEKQQNILDLQLDTISSLSSAFGTLGDSFDISGLKIACIIGEAIANILKGYSEASAKQAAGSITGWDWLAFSAAGLTQVASVIAQIHSLSGYAGGGIIGGNSYTGDKVLARVNSGEMILNPSQQANLFNMINGGVSTGGEVKFRIDGSTLVGVLNNYTKKTGRVI